MCLQNQSSDTSATCVALTSTTTCDKLYIGSTATYSHDVCNGLISSCTVNGTTNGCTAKTCANATAKTTFTECNTWLSSCTQNSLSGGSAACVAISATCSA
jgi:hypothetical protein